MPRINYEILSNNPDKIIIRDRCDLGGMSITNGAEAVVEELYRSGILKDGQILLYYDSDGQLDQLVHKDGKFVKFSFGGQIV